MRVHFRHSTLSRQGTVAASNNGLKIQAATFALVVELVDTLS